MAENSKIAWTDSTFNPWIGCTRVSPGCDHCYAEAQDARKRWGKTTHWGPGVPRMRTSASNWKQPLRWNRLAETQTGKSGRWLVFCASLADVFDNEVPEEWRHDLFDLIGKTPNLTWLILTKRIGNVAKCGAYVYPNRTVRPNVWLGASVGNQEEADRDIPKLLATPAAKRFVSYEPALGPVDFQPFLSQIEPHGIHGKRALDWIIVGGESAQGGAKARPFDIAWARSTVEQCKAAGVACFVKQLGSWVVQEHAVFGVHDRAGADPAEWPEDLRVQEFPA